MNSMARNHLLDNAKLIAIFMVVFGHLIEQLIRNSTIIKSIYMSIYSVHMPIFIIISGMLAANKLSGEQVKKLATTTLLPLLIFTLIYEVFNLVIFKSISSYTLNIQPYWILWFLYSMFFWKLILPLALKLKFPLLTALTISLVAGCFEEIGYFLGISRTVYFFPFFIVGYYLKNAKYSLEYFQKLPKTVYITIVIANLAFFYFNSDIQHQWLFGSLSYAFFEHDYLTAVGIKVAFYSLSFVSSIALLMLFPRKKYKFTDYGSNSLFVYVWHGFFIKFFIGVGLFALLEKQAEIVAITSLFLVALLLTSILSINLISKYSYKLLLNPFSKALLSKK